MTAIPTGITAPRRVPSTALESLLYATLVPLLSLRLGSRRGAVIHVPIQYLSIALSIAPFDGTLYLDLVPLVPTLVKF